MRQAEPNAPCHRERISGVDLKQESSPTNPPNPTPYVTIIQDLDDIELQHYFMRTRNNEISENAPSTKAPVNV